MTTQAQPALLIDVKAVAALLSVHTNTVWNWTRTGRLPQPQKFGSVTRWRRTDIEAVVDIAFENRLGG